MQGGRSCERSCESIGHWDEGSSSAEKQREDALECLHWGALIDILFNAVNSISFVRIDGISIYCGEMRQYSYSRVALQTPYKHYTNHHTPYKHRTPKSPSGIHHSTRPSPAFLAHIN